MQDNARNLSGSLPLPTKKSQVFIENDEVVKDLIMSLPTPVRQSNPLKTSPSTLRSEKSNSIDSLSTSLQQELLKEQIFLDRQKVLNDTQKNIERSLRKRADLRQQRMLRLERNIADCQKFLAEVDRSLGNHEEISQNKRRQQYEQWNESVFGEIQNKITSRISKVDAKELNDLRNQDYQKYLDITNRKAAIFRDIIIEGEYDPLEVNRRVPKIKLSTLKDPTNVYSQKKATEAAMLDVDRLTLKKPTFGKYTLPTELWASGKIESTPYGLERVRNVSVAAASYASRHKSKVTFDHFDFPRGKSALDAEMPRGKRAGGDFF